MADDDGLVVEGLDHLVLRPSVAQDEQNRHAARDGEERDEAKAGPETPHVLGRNRRHAHAISSRRSTSASLRCSRDRRSEEHTSELHSLMRISYAVFCLKKK